jgi:hypothetical protein
MPAVGRTCLSQQRCDLGVNTQGRSRRFSLLATVVIAAAAIHLAVIALTLLVTDRFAQADILLASFWILPVTWIAVFLVALVSASRGTIRLLSVGPGRVGGTTSPQVGGSSRSLPLAERWRV